MEMEDAMDEDFAPGESISAPLVATRKSTRKRFSLEL